MAKDYYKILELSREANPQAIKKAYHVLSRKWHPDKNPENVDEAKRRFQEISEAYQVLSNDRARHSYDYSGSSDIHFDSQFPPGYFKSAEELFKEMFGDVTVEEAVENFLNDPLFKDLTIEIKDGIVVTPGSSNSHINSGRPSSDPDTRVPGEAKASGGTLQRRSYEEYNSLEWARDMVCAMCLFGGAELADRYHYHRTHKILFAAWAVVSLWENYRLQNRSNYRRPMIRAVISIALLAWWIRYRNS